MAVIFFLFTKYAVLRRKESLKWGLLISPLYFMVAFSLGVLYLLLKGGKKITINGSNMTPLLLGAFGSGLFVAFIAYIFAIPVCLAFNLLVAPTKTKRRRHEVVSHLLHSACI
jgi:sodium-dependent phosphate transporter